MKRAGRIIEEATSYEALRLAWTRTRRGKACGAEALRFERELDENLNEIGQGLSSGTYRWNAFRTFKIFDPKERDIAAPSFRDRVAQHALFIPCEEVFNRRQIAQSCASRRGKGQSAALAYARDYARCGGFFLKMDVHHYFASIRRDLLKESLARLIKDKYALVAFYDLIDAYQPGAERGIPLGALASQFFANHYLAPLDNMIKREIRIARYVRYMDDFLLWAQSKDELRDARKRIEEFVGEKLDLELNPNELRRVSSGLSFLGMRVFPNSLRLGARGRLRFRRKYLALVESFARGELSEREYSSRALSLTSYAAQAETRAFRLRVIATGEGSRLQ